MLRGRLRVVALVAVVLAVCVLDVVRSSSTGTADSDVFVLTAANFDAETSSGTWLVEFYAPWCGHCKRLAPTYAKVASDLAGQVRVAKVDATEEQALAARFPLTGYPTIYHIKDGEVRQYKGGRTREALKAFALTGYTKADTLSFWGSPFSPTNRMKGALLGAVLSSKDLAALASVKLGVTLPVVLIGGTLVGSALIGVVMFAIVSCATREDRARGAHAHRD